MKLIRHIQFLLPFLILLGCSTGSNRFVFGPGSYGKNRLVKTESEEKFTHFKDLEKEQTPFNTAELDAIEDTLRSSATKDGIEPVASAAREDETINFEQKEDAIITLKKNLATVKRSYSKLYGKNGPLTSDDDTGTVVTVILIILIISILLSILLFYLIIKLINQAINDTAEEACYVATMTYGSYDHPKVKVLRNFRDEFLAERKWGRNFIQWYYKRSPSFVKAYQNNRFVNGSLRIYLNLFIFFISPFYKK